MDTPGIDQEIIDRFRRDGFVRVRGVISKGEAERFRAAAERVMETPSKNPDRKVFQQYVNTWQADEDLADLTLHPNIGRLVDALSGVSMRLWHDHLLVKEPHNDAPTHFHQDQPFWPHANSTHPLSCWVALNDVPVERGCMTFIPGSHRLTHLTKQNLEDAESLVSLAPELMWSERVTLPLQAGDCTFHHARTAHMANANETDERRYGFAIAFFDADATFTGDSHVVTNPLVESGALKAGDRLEHQLFPLASDIATGQTQKIVDRRDQARA